MMEIYEYPEYQLRYLKLKPRIDRAYPPGHFVALEQGEIIGDAPTFEELDDALTSSGKTSRDILVVQSGASYPEFIWIFTQGPLV